MSQYLPSLRLFQLGINLFILTAAALAQTDPGPRGGTPGAGGAIPGLSKREAVYFESGKAAFSEVASVSGTIPNTESGLGPRFNADSCAACHAHPAVGGTSPAVNPQFTIAPKSQVNPLVLLNIISANGPAREVRFKSDGGVHALFTIMGRPDTPAGCSISQPDFASHSASGDITFRIPTPLFGAGLIEAIPDALIKLLAATPKPFGIRGKPNVNGNDRTVTRFGWKAQNKSLVIFSGEAYNVEQGVSNELFPDERGEAGTPDPLACTAMATPNDHTKFEEGITENVPGDAIAFANFMRFSAPPAPVSSYGRVTEASVSNGKQQFMAMGCAFCHVPTLLTGNHSCTALANKPVNLFSDLLVHSMGRLGDGISQGAAGPRDFRTAPLWGLGQRLFFLHDGRTSDLVVAIEEHADGGNDRGSEAAAVVTNFKSASPKDKQDLLNFLRSL